MKRSIFALAAIAALSATPVLAQTPTGMMVQNQPQNAAATTTVTPTTPTTTPPAQTPPAPVKHCFGTLCAGQGFKLSVDGLAGQAGESTGVFSTANGVTGTVESNNAGGTLVDIGARISTCNSQSCPDNDVVGTLRAFNSGQSLVTARGTNSGVPVTAGTMSLSQGAAQFKATLCAADCK